jgi:ribosomal protein S18 acetylase RimI-like enzyme
MVEVAAFTVRLATVDDIDALTELHCACFGPDDHLPVLLGKQYIRAMYRWQVSGKEARTVIVESGGLAIAFGGVCDGPYMRSMIKACFGDFLISLVRNPWLLVDGRLWRRLLSSEHVLGKHVRRVLNRPGVAHLTIGAVDAHFRRRGIHSAYLEALIAISRSRGHTALCVGIRRSNHAVRRAFVKLGWGEVPASDTSELVHYITHLDPDSTCPDWCRGL